MEKSPNRKLITQELCKHLMRTPPPPRAYKVRDTKIGGFVIRVRATGTHSFSFEAGRGREKLLGRVGEMEAATARAEAEKLMLTQRNGEEPILLRRERKAQLGPTLRELIDPELPGPCADYCDADRVRVTFKALLDTQIGAITDAVVLKWRANLRRADNRKKRPLTDATINRNLGPLHALMELAVTLGLIAAHPFPRVKPLATDDAGVIRWLSPDEERRLRATLAARDERRRAERASANRWRAERGYELLPELGEYTDHLTPLVLLALNSGLRRGELLKLPWERTASGAIEVRGKARNQGRRGSKSGRTRYVGISPDARRVLDTWACCAPHGRAPGTLIFAGCSDKQSVNFEGIKSAWRRLMRQARIESFRFHDLRHTFASRLVMKGVDLYKVQALLGHKDPKQTQKYAHLCPSGTAAAVVEHLTSYLPEGAPPPPSGPRLVENTSDRGAA